MLVEVVKAMVEETPNPKSDEDPIPKWNVVPNPLRHEDNVLVDVAEVKGIEGPLVDEIGWVKGGGAELDIATDRELDIVGLVSTGPIKM